MKTVAAIVVLSSCCSLAFEFTRQPETSVSVLENGSLTLKYTVTGSWEHCVFQVRKLM